MFLFLIEGERAVAGLSNNIQEDGFFGESSHSRHFAGSSMNIN